MGDVMANNSWLPLPFYIINVAAPFPARLMLHKSIIPELHTRCNGAVGSQLWGLIVPLLQRPAHIFRDWDGNMVICGKPNKWQDHVLSISAIPNQSKGLYKGLYHWDGEITGWHRDREDLEISGAAIDWKDRYRLQWTRYPNAFRIAV